MHIRDTFNQSVDSRWVQVFTGGGKQYITNSTLRLGFESARKGMYTDAQIDDYTMHARSAYPWRPPLRMTVRSRSSLPAVPIENVVGTVDAMQGTAGFGFWNNPFSVRGDILTLPESIWFFYASQQSNMALVPGIPGWGWKAQVVHSMRFGFLGHIIPTSLDIVRNRFMRKSRPSSAAIQRLAGAHETLLRVDMTKWHTYMLEWYRDSAMFWVDGKVVLRVKQPPTSPLGFVAWVDNQYAMATPTGILRFGTLDSGPQWLEMDYIEIEKL